MLSSAALIVVFLRGQVGYAGTAAEQLAPGGQDPALGGMRGIAGGVRLIGLEAELERLRYGHGSVTRATLGLRPAVSLGRVRLFASGGVGLLSEHDGALDRVVAPGVDRFGLLVRGGVGVEARVARVFFVGAGVSAEYWASANDALLDLDVDGGFDVAADVHLTVELGF